MVLNINVRKKLMILAKIRPDLPSSIGNSKWLQNKAHEKQKKRKRAGDVFSTRRMVVLRYKYFEQI